MFIINYIIFINNFWGNNWQFDPCILWAVHRIIQANVSYIKSSKPCAWTRKVAAYYQIQEFQRPCWCCNIPRVADTISCHSYACKIGVVLVRSDLTHHTSVTYLLLMVVRNIFKFYDSKFLCALNTLLIFTTCAATNNLGKASQIHWNRMSSKHPYILGDVIYGYIPVIPQCHCLILELLYVLQVLGCTINSWVLQDTSFALPVLAELSNIDWWFGI